jgi:N-acetylglutamate synthase
LNAESLAWRVEEVCFAAWPALSEITRGDWRLRFAAGLTRRSNSANPLHGSRRHSDDSVEDCAVQFRARGLPAIFRIPSMLEPQADRVLDRLGYVVDGECVVLHDELKSPVGERDARVMLDDAASPQWFAAMMQLQRYDPVQAAIYEELVRSIRAPTAFAGFRVNETFVALAYGVISDETLCLESVITHPDHRGRGYMRLMLAALIAWAAARGASQACLQILAGNSAARALYGGLGLKRELYRYHYRREPLTARP